MSSLVDAPYSLVSTLWADHFVEFHYVEGRFWLSTVAAGGEDGQIVRVWPFLEVFGLGEHAAVLAFDARGHCVAYVVPSDREHVDGITLYAGWEGV